MKVLTFLFSILLTANVVSQEINTSDNNRTLPTSIYTSSLDNSKELNSASQINNKLNFTSFKFTLLNVEDIKSGKFSILTDNIGRQPTKFIYDTYTKIAIDKAITSTFFDIDVLYYNRTNCSSRNN